MSTSRSCHPDLAQGAWSSSRYLLPPRPRSLAQRLVLPVDRAAEGDVAQELGGGHREPGGVALHLLALLLRQCEGHAKVTSHAARSSRRSMWFSSWSRPATRAS